LGRGSKPRVILFKENCGKKNLSGEKWEPRGPKKSLAPWGPELIPKKPKGVYWAPMRYPPKTDPMGKKPSVGT